MLLTQVKYKQPVFKDGVFIQFKDNAIEIHYQDCACSLAIEAEYQPETMQLLRLLQIGGINIEQLATACPGLTEEIPELLTEFDRRGLLRETQKEVTSVGLTGEQFYRELKRFLNRRKLQFPPSPFVKVMAEGKINKNQLIGYVLESYHVTHLCPKLLAPALANYESSKTHKILQEFFVSELHHDRLVENSLKSVGIEGKQIELMQPLPMTFALCSSLAVFAKQHPLSFKAALMLFEEDDQTFHDLFKQCSQSLGLPQGFYKPILLHAGINEEGEHADITKFLLAEVPYVSPEEQLVVKKNLVILMESMVLRTHEIFNYYGNPNHKIPRCFT